MQTLASRDNPDIRVAIETLRQADLDVKSAKNAFLPTLTLETDYGLEANAIGLNEKQAAFPELGLNAADALVVAQTAIGLLRQHIRHSDRVHGIVTKGGDAPNVVPAHTSAPPESKSRPAPSTQLNPRRWSARG